MTVPSLHLRRLAIDWRVWGVSVLFLGWYAVGTVTPDASPVHLFTLPIFALMSSYYATLGVLTVQLGPASFWGGFALYCFALAAILVRSVDTLCSRYPKGE